MLHQQANSNVQFMALDIISRPDQPDLVQHVTAKIYEDEIQIAISHDLLSPTVDFISLSPELMCAIALKWNELAKQESILDKKEEEVPVEPSRIIVDEEQVQTLRDIDDEVAAKFPVEPFEPVKEDFEDFAPFINEPPEGKKPYNPSFKLSATKIGEVLERASEGVKTSIDAIWSQKPNGAG